MNHLYVNFFFTHEREGFWHPVQLDRGRERCFKGICDRRCLLAARGEKPSGDGAPGSPPYCAWLIPCEGEALGHYTMVEGGKGEIGRVYNPYVVKGHLPSSRPDHPLARAFSPAKHALLTEFYRRGHKASYHFARDDQVEYELGREEQRLAMKIALDHPEWQELFLLLAKDFLWTFPVLPVSPSRAKNGQESVLPSLGGAGTASVSSPLDYKGELK